MTCEGNVHGRLPDVAVLMISYNHETFIAESIDSVLGQEYPGKIHLLVSDDCSTDRTQQVIVDAIARAPSNVVVQALLRDQNVGGLRNLTEGWEWANGTEAAYIALLEGDDYWTHSHKLALQVGYLEQHRETTLSFGLASELICFEDPPSSALMIVPPNAEPTFGDLLRQNFIHTCTVVYRRGVLPHFPEWFAECSFRDWPLHLAHASAGDLHYLDQEVAVHRQHSGSRWWSSATSRREKSLATLRIQQLAMAQLGRNDNFRRVHVLAGRQLFLASASESRRLRWLHCAAAVALEPVAIVKTRRFKRRSRRRDRRTTTP